MTAEATSLWYRFWHTRWRDVLRGQLDGRLDWRRTISAADLPSNIRGVIEQVVRGTRLWRGEKMDVAGELIAHFHDGLEAGASPEALLASFGDPQQAARLIRRAKRRGRSAGWQFWHWACIGAGALVAVYAAMVLYQMTGRPTIKVNYLAMYNQRAVSSREEERAWPLYRQALSQLMIGRELPAWIDDRELGPTDAAWPQAVAWLKNHEAALAMVREATKRPEMGFAVGVSPKSFSPADQQLFYEPTNPGLDPQAPPRDRIEDQFLVSAHLPHLLPLRNLAFLLAIDTRRAALGGDGDTAIANVRTILGIAEHVQQMPSLITTVTALVIQRTAYAAVQDVLSLRPELWSAGQLRDLAHLIAASEVNWRDGIKGERAMFYDIIQRFYTDDGQGDGRLAFRGPDALNVIQGLGMLSGVLSGSASAGAWTSDSVAALALPAANLTVASRKEATDTYDRFTDQAAARIATPLWMPLPALDNEVRSLTRAPLGRFRHLFVEMLLPAYDRVRNRIAEAGGEKDGALVGLALESYRREESKWPTSLDELSPRWMPEVPVDRITGRPLGYKVVDDRPVVFSMGVDRDEDGGRPATIRVAQDQAKPNAADGESTDWPPRATNLPENLASPEFFEPQPAIDREHDGDWVIWSTSPKE
jgi:hypothetical protein